MNFLTQCVRFYELSCICKLSSKAQALYYCLLNINNKCCWIREFSVANTLLCTILDINAKSFFRAREELINNKFITYKKGKKNKAGFYSIVKLKPCYNEENNTNDETKAKTE